MKGNVLAFLAGVLCIFAFAPFNIFPLGIIAPALLLACWMNVSARRAFWRGGLFGIGFFSTGVYWVFISIHQFGNAPVALALLITAVFIMILSLFPAMTGYFLNRFFPNPVPIKWLGAFPVIWVMLEWVRSWIFTGFPWLLLGDSQINSPLKGFASLFSVYGVSWAALLSSSLIVLSVIAIKQRRFKTTLFYLISLCIIWFAGYGFSTIHWTTPASKPIQVSLVQGNVAQALKWSPEQVQPTLDLYRDLTEQHLDSRIIIWPEAAVPITLHSADHFLKAMASQAGQKGAAIITGIPIRAPNADAYYNAVITLGDGVGLYIKRHLVPFGEFTPLQQYFGKLLDFFEIPLPNMVPGQKEKTAILIDQIKIAVFICYEIAFPEEVRRHDDDTGIILTVTNDAWFGHSIAQVQHLQIAKMRALELGRPVLFVSNNGITAFITPDGKTQSAIPPFEQAVLTDTVQPMQGETPWQRFGIDPLLLLLLATLVLALYKTKRP